jgi:hypothetical protein
LARAKLAADAFKQRASEPRYVALSSFLVRQFLAAMVESGLRCEKLSLLGISREITDDLAFGTLNSELLQVASNVLHSSSRVPK